MRWFPLHKLLAAAVLIISLQGAPAMAERGGAVDLDIPMQALDSALRQVAQELHLQIIFASQDVAKLRTDGLKGRFTAQEAVAKLLVGTPLVYAFNGQDTIAIMSRSGVGGSSGPPGCVEVNAALRRLAGRSSQDSAICESKVAPGAEMNSPTGHSGSSVTTIEEVMVTAQRRVDYLQNVPISISVFTAKQIEERGIHTLVDLSSLAPNLQVSRAPNYSASSQVSIRGAVTTNNAMYMETTVGIYVDGVYLGKSMGSLMDYLDVERIEVLRGPQGTLYGRNTLAGAINFVTRKPLGEFSGTATLEVGDYGAVTKKILIDLPKMGITSISFGLRSDNRNAIYQTLPGSAAIGMENRNDDAGRIAMDIDIARNFQAELKFDSSRFNRLSGYHTLASSQLNAYRPSIVTDRNAPVALRRRAQIS